MKTMNPGTPSSTDEDVKLIDLKQAVFEVTPVDTVTPSLTPTSAPEGNIMAGRKLYSLERPDDRAKELASKLTLEEQVCGYDRHIALSISQKGIWLCERYAATSGSKPQSRSDLGDSIHLSFFERHHVQYVVSNLC